jgi:hypothetical protein
MHDQLNQIHLRTKTRKDDPSKCATDWTKGKIITTTLVYKLFLKPGS